MNQTEEDYLIYDADDEAIQNWLKNNKTKAKLSSFFIDKTMKKKEDL
jgi:UDP-N-acetylmuramoylalanine--D-glutamate ligase